jgi:hypothetical protein
MASEYFVSIFDLLAYLTAIQRGRCRLNRVSTGPSLPATLNENLELVDIERGALDD